MKGKKRVGGHDSEHKPSIGELTATLSKDTNQVQLALGEKRRRCLSLMILNLLNCNSNCMRTKKLPQSDQATNTGYNDPLARELGA